MTLLFALLFARPAAALDIFVLDDGDSNAADLFEELRAWGHTVTSSQDSYGFTESEFTSTTRVTLTDYDAVIWLDGGDDTFEQMSSTGQAALYSYVSGGGGLLLFGATGYQASASGYYSSYLSLIPLRSSTYAGDRTWAVADASHPATEGLSSSFTPDGGVIADTSASFGSTIFSYTWFSTTYVGGVAATVGSGRLVQSALWGNTTWLFTPYEVDWTDGDVSQMVESALQWIVLRPPEVKLDSTWTVPAEGTVLMSLTSGSDPDGGSVSYAWDIGADGSIDCTGSTCTFTAAGYDGPDTVDVVLTVTDDEGETTEAEAEIQITNVAPTISRLISPSPLDEGSAGSLSVEYGDVEAADTHTVSWSFGDGESGSGETTSHTWRDDGEYTVTVTVTDDDGGSASTGITVIVDNVAPTLTGSPDGTATVGIEYTFNPGASDPGLDDVLVFGGSFPDGAAISSTSGALRWTPSRDQVGVHSLRLTVEDGDGGSDELNWEVDVQLSDRDGDGMPDEWEEAYGLDPDDPSDAELDRDGDGRTSLEEYEGDSDPTVYEGPGVPSLLAPADGERVASASPSFTVGNAEAPLGQTLVYGFEVYADEALSARVGGAEGVSSGEGTTSWTWTDAALTENTDYWWTSWAADDYVTGAEATPPFRLFVNEVNEAPGAPTVVTPFDGAVVETLDPEFQLGEASDPDRDTLSYRLLLLDSGEASLDEAVGLGAEEGLVRWSRAESLVDGQRYCWYGEALDPGGLVGPPSELACFEVDLENDPPSAPLILAPADGSWQSEPHPEIRVENGVDPEGRATVHEFQLDLSASFDSAALQQGTVASGEDGQTAWTPTEALSEDQTWFVRVRCSDGAERSDWAEASFQIGDGEGAPTAPTLISPTDGSEVEGSLALRIGAAVDPDGDSLSYELVIIDRGGAAVRTESGLPEGEDGQIDWSPEMLEPGVYSWTARAVDSTGLAGPWAGSWAFAIGEGEALLEEDEAVKAVGCSCASAGSSSPGAALSVLGLLALAGLRRRAGSRP